MIDFICAFCNKEKIHFSVLREQWIRAKYERKEFISPPMTSYADDYLEGFLYKRGKEDGKFLQRKFVLSSVEGTLKYFIKEVSLPLIRKLFDFFSSE